MGEYVPYKKLEEIVEDEKSKGYRVVLTGGCFDIVHPGHLYLFRKARELGDVLVVNVVNDERVKKYKGNNRPIIPELQRALMVSSIGLVAYSTIHPDIENGPTIELARIIRPDVIVQQSGRWTREDKERIRGLLGPGVELRTVRRSYVQTSTTKIIRKIKKTV